MQEIGKLMNVIGTFSVTWVILCVISTYILLMNDRFFPLLQEPEIRSSFMLHPIILVLAFCKSSEGVHRFVVRPWCDLKQYLGSVFMLSRHESYESYKRRRKDRENLDNESEK